MPAKKIGHLFDPPCIPEPNDIFDGPSYCCRLETFDKLEMFLTPMDSWGQIHLKFFKSFMPKVTGLPEILMAVHMLCSNRRIVHSME